MTRTSPPCSPASPSPSSRSSTSTATSTPPARRKHAVHLAGRGVRALVVAGTTGEASHLSMKERLQLLDAVRAAVPATTCRCILGTGNLAAGVSVPHLTRRAAEHGAARRPHAAAAPRRRPRVLRRGGRRRRRHAGPRLPLARRSPPASRIEELKAMQGRRPEGLDRRPRAPARGAGPLPPAGLHGQRRHHRLRRPARVRRRHPGRRQPRARAVHRRLRRQHRRPRRTCSGRTRSSACGVKAHQGGAGPPPRHQHRLPLSAARAEHRRRGSAATSRSEARRRSAPCRAISSPSSASRPTVRPGRSATRFTASSTPGMNEVRS